MKTKTRKDLIKNIAIIFLAVMLVLTFFSNTILNWSLPQVSGKYTEYGEIKTGVRGSGTAVSNMTYTESIKGHRTVEAVYVNRGTMVEQGDLLMLLSATETEGIEALEAEIASMQEAYERALLSRSDNDYSSDEMAIKNAEEDLNELKKERGVYTDTYIAQLKKNADDAEKAVEAASAKVEALEEEIEELSESSDQAEIVEARKVLEKKTEAFNLAKEAYERAQKALENAEFTGTDSLEAQRDSLYSQLDNLEKELKYLKEDHADVLDIAADYNTKESEYKKAESAYEKAKKAYENDDSQLPDAEKETYKAMIAAETKKNEAKAAYDAALVIYNDNLEEIKTVKRAIEQKNSAIAEVEDEIYYLRNAITDAQSGNREYNGLKAAAELKKTALDTAEKELETATKNLEDIVKKYNKTKTEELKTAKKTLEKALETKADSDDKLGELAEIEAMDEQIKSAERSLASMKLALERQKENDSRSEELEKYDLDKQYKAIQNKKAELEELRGESKEGYELRASRGGIITEVNFRAGEIAADGASAVVIEVEESGYTLAFSVSNSEAQKVKVGDTAQVSDTYWGQEIGAVLKSITPDSGGKSKTLTFELSGNVNVGQNLTLLVGDRTTSYSAVIPKTAVREDSKGKFIYITKTKSTPLGNRYVATRMNVKIAAEDDKNVAIVTDDTYINEYVIVSSTKPFEEGGYVRLSDE